MEYAFLTSWSGFIEDAQRAGQALLAEVRASVADLGGLDAEVAGRLEAVQGVSFEAGRTRAFASLYEGPARTLLVELVDRYRSLRIDERFSRAFAEFDSSLEERVSMLPVRDAISPRALIDALEDSSGMPWWIELVRLRDRERTVLVRAAVLDGLSTVRFGQRRVEGGLYLFGAQSTLALLDPWQLLHSYALEQLRGVATADDRATFDKARAAWDQSAALRRDQGKILVEQLEENLEVVSAELTGALVRGPRPSVHRRQLGRVREYRSYWSRQRAAVRALVQTEVSLASLGAESVRIAEETVAEVRKEYEAITGELNAAIDALRSWSPGDRDPLPHASSRLSSADERTRLWTSGMDRKVRRLLQDQIESVEPRRPLPGLRKPWRQIGPGRIFGEAVQTASATAREGFGTVETAHRSLIREIDRSREVVAYSLQAGRGDADRGEQLAVEGVTNALSLLTHSLGSARDPEPHLETHLVEATSAAFYQFLVAFERGRFSLTSYLAREGAARAARTALDVAGEQLQSSGPRALEGLQRGFRWCLVQIGWAAPSDASLIPVETWSYFGGEKVSESLKELPLIYERLFRPEPVEDRRFLIGRDEEMTALEEACGFWKEGRFASVILEGERGSGKTSILNCAAIGPFAAENAVRTAVRERLLTAADVHAFLAGVLGVEPGDLRSDLGKQRRVIIIEEAERTFLRMVGGLEAIRELLSLIADTSRTNLWLLGMTREGFRFLDRALGLAGHFSHRLHASAVARSELQDAILQRHNLSGLRLEFTEPQSRGRIQDWLGRQTARVESPEDAFFRGLHELSGGVFRSAFSTWRRHIERVDGGVLRMRRLDVPDHSRLARALSREDLYSLQMILQHGSLTPAEHARMFDCPPSESQARMAHLAGRGILEPEPSVPGFRIQPEAVILVRGALNGRNLV